MLQKLQEYATCILLAYITAVIVLHVIPFSLGDDIAPLNKIMIFELRLDYLLHAILFIPWSVIIWFAYGISFRSGAYKAIILIITGIIFAFGAEYIQNYLDYRAYNINDVAGNIAGVLIGSVVFFWKSPFN